MAGAVIDVLAAVLVTAAIVLLPGAALLAALRAGRIVPPLLRPAACIAGTLAIASPALVATLSFGWSIRALAIVLAGATVACGVVGLLRWKPAPSDASAPRPGLAERLRTALPFTAPAAVLVVLGVLDAPQVRSDTYWHVALARKLAELHPLSSSAISFEAGAPGNANYPLPVWHSLLALADHAPRVDVWSATWFVTLWLAPVAMLAFGGMASALVGDRRAALTGCWAFVAVVVLGYGPYFFATRYLSYPGQIAIYALLPIVAVALVRVVGTTGRTRAALLALAGAVTIEIGLLHGNYVLYPVLLAWGGGVLLLLGGRERWQAAWLSVGVVTLTGVATLAAQLPWITNDDNFLRGDADPLGEPTAFVRHRDVFQGTEQSHHVVLGSMATQPMLVLGALAIPVLLLLARRRPGPWFLAGGAAAIVVFARSPQLIELIDRLGSVTPATRFDRVYPAAVGVIAIALGIGWLLDRSWRRGRGTGAVATGFALAALAGLSWWADSIRDTRRIVVTQFVEARWVGGLDPHHLPWVAVVGATLLTFAVVAWIRFGTRDRALDSEPAAALPAPSGRSRPHVLAALALVAVAAGLAPATIDRASKTWHPEAYVRAQRNDANYTPLEVYPPAARRVLATIPAKAVVLAGFNDTRRIASLAPVYSVEESVLREIVASPPEPGDDAAKRLDGLVREWKATYVAANAFDKPFRPMLEAAAADPCRYEQVATGNLRIYRVLEPGDDCRRPADVDEP